MEELEQELMALQAVYPSELRITSSEPYQASLDLPITLETSLEMHEVDGSPFTLSYLPSLHLELHLPRGYPEHDPPKVEIAELDPSWLPRSLLSGLEEGASEVWEMYGRAAMLFTYMNMLQDRVVEVARSGALAVAPDVATALRTYDAQARQTDFDMQTFTCEICLEVENGTVCHAMLCCRTVYCLACLGEFYTCCVQEGRTGEVRCLSDSCNSNELLGPRELLDVGVGVDVVRLYLRRKRQRALETDPETVWCPRTWCSGASNGDRHPKVTLTDDGKVLVEKLDEPKREAHQPTKEAISGVHGFQSWASSTQQSLTMVDGGAEQALLDCEEEAVNTNTVAQASALEVLQEPTRVQASTPRLAICSDCSLAFCATCSRSWHGTITACPAMPDSLENNNMLNKLSAAYISNMGVRCPNCRTPTEKISGCDHMKCTRCTTHFCWACSAKLESTPPWKHIDGACKRIRRGEMTVVEGANGPQWGYG